MAKKEVIYENQHAIDIGVGKYTIDYSIIVIHGPVDMSVYLAVLMKGGLNPDIKVHTELPYGYSLKHLHPLRPRQSEIDYYQKLECRRDTVADVSSCGPYGSRDGRHTAGHFCYRVKEISRYNVLVEVKGDVYPYYGVDKMYQVQKFEPDRLPEMVAWLLDYMNQSIAYINEVADELREKFCALREQEAKHESAAEKSVESVKAIIKALGKFK